MRPGSFGSSRTYIVRFTMRFTPPTKLRWLAFERRSASQIQNSPTPDNHKHESRLPVRHEDAVLSISVSASVAASISSSVSSLISSTASSSIDALMVNASL
jgi:hypothetical protein